MTSLRLYKREKLCSLTAIELLFAKKESQSASAYPLRAVWRVNERRSGQTTAQFFISIPKKRLKHAVDRVKMRRRTREAYRLSRHMLQLPENTPIDIAFIYLAYDLQPYTSIERAMAKLLGKISSSFTASTAHNDDNKDS